MFKTDNGSLYLDGEWYIPVELNRSAGDMGLEFPNLYTYYETPEVTCEDVRKAARDVPVVASNLDKYRRFIFNAAKIVPVPPEDTEISEEEQLEVQQRVNEIDRVVKTVTRMQQAWQDKKVFGSAIFEYKQGNLNGWKAPVKFKHLPAYSFDTQPGSRVNPDVYIPGDILKGIIYDNSTDVFEYWQRQSSGGQPIQIDTKNVLHVRDEVADAPDGKSSIAMIMGLVKRLQFAEVALVQTVNRAGAPGLWASIKQYREEPPAVNPEAWSFSKSFKQGQKIVQNWGKSSVIVAPDSIELKALDSKLAIDPTKVIDHYEKRILYTLIARDFTEQTGQAISQSAKPGLTLLVLMARSEQEEIAEPFIELWKQILEANGKVGWSIEIQWRDLIEASETELYTQAKLAMEVGAWTKDELRDIANWSALSDEQKIELGISEEDSKTSVKQSPKTVELTDDDAIPKTALTENTENSDVAIEELLKMKANAFLELCKEKGVEPWNTTQ